MDILRRLFGVFFAIFALGVAGLSCYIYFNGKSLIEQRISAALQKDVRVGRASLIFPVGLSFDGLEIKDALTAKSFRVRFAIPIFFGGHFNIAKVQLVEPVFYFTYTPENAFVWGRGGGEPPERIPSMPEGMTADPSRATTLPVTAQGIVIDFLEVDNGRFQFFDQAHNIDVDIGRIDIKAINIALPPRDVATKFDLSALVQGDNTPFAGKRLEARGTANLGRLDMDASARVVDADNQNSFFARLNSKNNQMVVKGTINIGRFVSGIRTPDSKESALEGFLASAIAATGVDIGVNFLCETRMDRFNCDRIGLKGNFAAPASASVSAAESAVPVPAAP